MILLGCFVYQCVKVDLAVGGLLEVFLCLKIHKKVRVSALSAFS